MYFVAEIPQDDVWTDADLQAMRSQIYVFMPDATILPFFKGEL
jgi:hypothetical protein